ALRGQRRPLRRLVPFLDQPGGQLPKRSRWFRNLVRCAGLGTIEQGRTQAAAQVHVGPLRRRAVGADHDGVDRAPVDGIVQERTAARAIGVVCAVALTYQLEKTAAVLGTHVLDQLESYRRELEPPRRRGALHLSLNSQARVAGSRVRGYTSLWNKQKGSPCSVRHD